MTGRRAAVRYSPTRQVPTLLVRILRGLGLALLASLGAAALVFLGDTAAFYLRGQPQDRITVTRYLAAPLKDHKTELFYEGTGPYACARALFPQAGMDPCWYRRRHPLYADSL